MKDFLGNELEVGDFVVMMLPGYRVLTKGIVQRFTKCYVMVNYQMSKSQGGSIVETKQEPHQLVKIS